jgi:hypothetical protein
MIANLKPAIWDRENEEIVLALTAVAALTGSASAADIAARPYKVGAGCGSPERTGFTSSAVAAVASGRPISLFETR